MVKYNDKYSNIQKSNDCKNKGSHMKNQSEFKVINSKVEKFSNEILSDNKNLSNFKINENVNSENSYFDSKPKFFNKYNNNVDKNNISNFILN